MLLFILCTEKNRVISVTAAHYTELRRGPVRDAINIINNDPYYKERIPKITQNGCYCPSTNSTLEFVAFPNAETAKGGKRDYLFVNEATGLDYEVFFELQMRTKIRTWVDFNPSSRFWCHKYFLDNPVAEWIYSTHWANKYLPDKIHRELENLVNIDENKYNVYCLGKCGKTEDLVYQNWSLTLDLPEDYKWRIFGLDFGFSNDPTAIVEVRFSEGKFFLKEWLYEKGFTNFDIAKFLKENKLDKQEIICDSAEMKSIEELKRLGIYLAKPAKKGPGSINTGIDLLKSYKMLVTRDSENLQTELLHYSYKKDNSGQLTNCPIDRYNHLLDCTRYCISYKMPKESSIRTSL